ncbi:bifunctional hydroxymethylpyrimidine kinase/phosphomethylpyrimidine kinase [Haladaptatus sp. F3-133]|uniref:Bifunctional hydroxymethylpyrimidine kinase/phosphomethylpyrimidine kinase n=1 Tax=Halorutilus salinus TaxID=2487751 RepID=A0A9Q4C3C9_9EURY|nr:bifunctional hydroxymethylpyrimidine kinase/phosphomethylpyrimidine kinase [Halorutilus salinus]MCX2818306.1 bifunctional hydroxymethylpyrimidine kinase/phosphomethylpyrimidine kinase [Halorutilus salinus]
MTDTNVALTVAGSDSGGGAGIQADLKTMEAFGVFGTSAVTSLTAQNSTGVRGVHDTPSEFVAEQIDAVVEDFNVTAAKTGMLSNAETARVVAEKIDEHDLTTVVDPVMIAQSGDRLLSEEAEEVVRDELLPRASLVTPNAPEAETLTGVGIDSSEGMREAARELVDAGAEAAVVTGGHIEGDEVVDVLADAETTERYTKPRVEGGATHGTGCAFSSAVAAELANGASLRESVARAEGFLYRAVRYGLEVGEGADTVHHLVGTRNDAARLEAVEAVRVTVERFGEIEGFPALLPEVGTNVGVATPYAVEHDEIAAVEGRLRRTDVGFVASCVRLGASGHVARYLLGLRDHLDDEPGAVCNLRNNAEVREALGTTGMNVLRIDRADQPDETREGEGGTMGWSARTVASRDGFPDAVVDAGAVGKEPMVRIAARDADELVERVESIAEALDG